MCFDIENFYLSTPPGIPEYVKNSIVQNPQEFINEYNMISSAHKVWVSFEIHFGCYRLPQFVILSNKQLRLRLEKIRIL